jgi:hypothetical protein
LRYASYITSQPDPSFPANKRHVQKNKLVQSRRSNNIIIKGKKNKSSPDRKQTRTQRLRHNQQAVQGRINHDIQKRLNLNISSTQQTNLSPTITPTPLTQITDFAVYWYWYSSQHSHSSSHHDPKTSQPSDQDVKDKRWTNCGSMSQATTEPRSWAFLFLPMQM